MRALVALLLAANLGFFAWSQGWLDDVTGLRASGDREPERLTRQVHPEAIVVLAASTGPAEAAPPPTACLEAGPFDEVQWPGAQAAARAALPGFAWRTVSVDRPGSWLVYVGRYASREAMTRKEDELKRRQLAYDEVADNPALTPGLSLGRFDDRDSAARALAVIEQQGVRAARVVQAAAPSVGHLLRADKADPAQAAALRALKADALGTGFSACAQPPGG